jgi:3-hydroxybutyryl-CoA dehydratase
MSEPPAIAPVSRLLDHPRVHLYANASGDRNPIHTDAEVASSAWFGQRVAHGMLVLALVSEMMTAAFGERWATSGALKVRWRAPALPPVLVTARAALRSAVAGLATYDVTCETADGAVLMAGTASAAYE